MNGVEELIDKSKHPVCSKCFHVDSKTSPCLDPVPCDEVPPRKLKPQFKGDNGMKKAKDETATTATDSQQNQEQTQYQGHPEVPGEGGITTETMPESGEQQPAETPANENGEEQTVDAEFPPSDETAEDTRVKVVRTSEYLRCEFTEEELKDLAQSLAGKIQELRQRESDKKRVVKSIDSDIAQLEAEIGSTASKVHDKCEWKDVKCEWRFDYEAKTKSLVRLDTGETVKITPLTSSELQLELV